MKPKPLSIYVHIPFCENKCSYCDFVSFDNAKSQIDSYIGALTAEIKQYSNKCKNHIIETIYLGGGTPSILTKNQISKIFISINENFTISETPEISIECNPRTITSEKLKHYRSLGINRISIGVQSVNEITLGTLGRTHTRDHIDSALKTAHECGFENISIDFMYSVPVPADIADANLARNVYGELNYLLARHPCITHVSPYCLNVYESTPIAKMLDFQQLYELNEDIAIDEELDMEDALRHFGFKRYEVSNWARDGYTCQHNEAYWKVRGEYLGFGLSASGLFNNERYDNTSDLNMYLLDENKVITSVPRTNLDIINESIILGLRTKYGINTEHLKKLGVNLQICKTPEILELANMGLLKVTKKSIRATDDGFMLLNLVTTKLMIENYEEESGGKT